MTRLLLFVALATLVLGACQPTVRVATDEPIRIQMDVNIRHEILVRVERELERVFEENSEIF